MGVVKKVGRASVFLTPSTWLCARVERCTGRSVPAVAARFFERDGRSFYRRRSGGGMRVGRGGEFLKAVLGRSLLARAWRRRRRSRITETDDGGGRGAYTFCWDDAAKVQAGRASGTCVGGRVCRRTGAGVGINGTAARAGTGWCRAACLSRTQCADETLRPSSRSTRAVPGVPNTEGRLSSRASSTCVHRSNQSRFSPVQDATAGGIDSTTVPY